MKERIINNNIMIPADNKATEITQPRKRSLNLIPAFISSHFASIIIFLSLVVAPVRANQFDASFRQTLTKRVTIITLVGNKTPGIFSRSASAFTMYRDIIQRFFQQRTLVRGRRVQVVSQRNTLAVDHHHPLRSLAAFGLSDALPPFLAGAKLPSANASLQSSWPRWSSSERKARHALSHTSCSSQSRSLLQHVEELGYISGKSDHGAPVRNIHNIPSNTFLSSAHGLPPRFDRLCFGSKGSILLHCASVSFQRFLVIEKTPFDDQVYISLYRAQA
jgi:hypothetical protein